MRARQLIDSASFGPASLKVIGQAFDRAWASIAGNFSDTQKEAARLTLANALLSVATDDSRDAEALKDEALDAMRRRH
jgi:hypothetical protein